MAANHISKVAVVGAGGNVGRYITEALLKTGKHSVTAITRADSQSNLPDGVEQKTIDYSKHESIVEALRGLEALVITLGARSGIKETEEKLVRAAADAEVPWILPNEWSPDSTNEGYLEDLAIIFGPKVATRNLIEQLGKSSYIALCTGFWYEYSLAGANNYGFYFADRKIRYFDEGETKICTSTWPQVGRAVASILSLPVKAEDVFKTSASLGAYRNKVIYVNSFTISQKDMLTSTLRVTDTKEEDWIITKEPAPEVYKTGMEQMKAGGWPKANFLYSRVFYADGSGDFEHQGLQNDVLGLPREELDDATKAAIERQKAVGAAGH
ncbi:hypothetical protein BAUCODRAFT_146168 [Baudoinia panamericana UAMH 10762]|uniref:NmrA-like domain-containing protein n=1 Tax=Baudoinia panamericana (strain UAMH 10762) TaxID=717646 RepID=M2LWY3_BAUPA|nr:uncharacterized protein BAUCODRAFT_146168 [Baudoinia panamericana UAMH 10762]EMC99192.1 hypothetical protein BAUCODRAFT_146168 [Baudoinia panamericana UAMH 10762]